VGLDQSKLTIALWSKNHRDEEKRSNSEGGKIFGFWSKRPIPMTLKERSRGNWGLCFFFCTHLSFASSKLKDERNKASVFWVLIRYILLDILNTLGFSISINILPLSYHIYLNIFFYHLILSLSKLNYCCITFRSKKHVSQKFESNI